MSLDAACSSHLTLQPTDIIKVSISSPPMQPASLQPASPDTYQVEVLFSVQILHCEEERHSGSVRLKPKSTSTGDFHVKRHLYPKNPNTKLVFSTTSDLNVSPCFGVVYCIMGLVASTLGGTLRET